MSADLAKRLHDAFFMHCRVEDEIGDLLDQLYGPCVDGKYKWSEFTSDYYDNSIEVYGVTPTPSAVDGLHAAGFEIVWEHSHELGTPSKLNCGCPARASAALKAALAKAKAAASP